MFENRYNRKEQNCNYVCRNCKSVLKLALQYDRAKQNTRFGGGFMLFSTSHVERPEVGNYVITTC